MPQLRTREKINASRRAARSVTPGPSTWGAAESDSGDSDYNPNADADNDIDEDDADDGEVDFDFNAPLLPADELEDISRSNVDIEDVDNIEDELADFDLETGLAAGM